MTKICTICNSEYDISNFNRNNYGRLGVDNRCKLCESSYKKLLKIRKKSNNILLPDNKTCRVCNVEKNQEFFIKKIDTKDGLSNECSSCSYNLYRKNRKVKDYVIKESKVCPRCKTLKNCEHFRTNINRKDLLDVYCRECHRKDRKEYMRRKRSSDINFRLENNLRSRLSELVKNINRQSGLREYLGCTIEEFKVYMESQFTEGKSWENYGKGGWELDHIYPLSMIDLSVDYNLNLVCNYKNIQPLWKKENITKNNNLDFSLEIVRYIEDNKIDKNRGKL